MAQCPKCGTQINDDGFMVICPGCRASLFFDTEGNLVDPSEDVGEDPSAADPYTNFSDADPSIASVLSQSAQNSSPDASPQDPAQTPDSNAYGDHGFAPFGQTDQNTANQDPFSQSGLASPTDPYDQQASSNSANETSGAHDEQSLSSHDEQMLNENGFSFEPQFGAEDQASGFTDGSTDFGPPGDPLGLSSYANSEISQAKDGHYLFTILISGIDSKELKNSIREAIEDSRFGWDASQILGRINKGQLRIEQVPPVKASILVNRIKMLPLKIRWEQYAITQMEDI